ATAELLKIDGLPASVRIVNLAGEPLQNRLVERIYQQDTVEKVFNLYGPSEDTTYSTFAWVKKGTGKIPPIGRPVANTQIYLLDKHLQPVPIGVPGELYISGEGLARGYLNRPELTAEKFIPNPFKSQNSYSERLYKTGDLARYLPDGNIEFLGRIDNQVKVRGFRIELGEIEALVSQHQGVREVVVVAREDEQGSKRLVAYTVLEPEQVPTITELRRFLEKKLPSYMIPSAFVTLDALPLTPNGKLDRKALPAPDSLRPQLEATYIKPKTDLEKTIATVWQKALKLETVGIHDNFFDLGGHSLLIVQVHSELCQLLKADFSMLELFRYPTISSLASFLNRLNTNEPSSFQQTDARIKQLKEGKTRIQQILTISKRGK
ncbi:MAG: AMP-binding protein, partial [Moorea sp. SIO2I5]|nr:AMP-binding protein [Moorena sp. SIO2I5]